MQAVSTISDEKAGISLGVLLFLPIVALIWVIFSWIFAKLSYRFYKYELHESGFRKERGIIWKKYTTIPYDRIQNVDIQRGVLSRIFGLSDLLIQTAGATYAQYGGAEGRLPGLNKPVAEQLRDELIRRVSNSKNQGL